MAHCSVLFSVSFTLFAIAAFSNFFRLLYKGQKFRKSIVAALARSELNLFLLFVDAKNSSRLWTGNVRSVKTTGCCTCSTSCRCHFLPNWATHSKAWRNTSNYVSFKETILFELSSDVSNMTIYIIQSYFYEKVNGRYAAANFLRCKSLYIFWLSFACVFYPYFILP